VEGVWRKTETGHWKAGILGDWAVVWNDRGNCCSCDVAFFTDRVHRNCACPYLFLEPDCRVRKQAFPPRPPSQRPTCFCESRPGRESATTGRHLHRWRDGAGPGARSKERATVRLMFCRLQLLAVNYSMSRLAWWVWWIGGVRSCPLLCNGVPGATAWDGMERGPGARKWRPIPRQRQLEASRFAPVLKSSCRI
jgi:hypothetical protein